MSFAHGLPAVRLFRPGRRVALVCLIVAAASAVTSFALGSPLSRSWSAPSDVDWLPFIGGMLPLLAMCASALGLFGGKSEGGIAAVPEVEALIRQLNDTLAGQREEVTRLQRSCETATQDAAAASARVTRAADAAIDAETRLASGIAQWERKLEEHLASATPYGGTATLSEDGLAARVVQRIEGVMPDFADIIRTKFSAFPDPSFHIAAGRLNATVEAAMVTFKGVIDDASHKMNSLNEISQSLRRDAVALDLAGREIATAGATVVARAGETISGVDAALASLPAAVASMNGAAVEMKGSLEEATLTMRANRTALMTAGDQAAQSAGRLLAAGSAIEEQREAVDAASERITCAVAEVIARVDAAQADRATLTDLIGRLQEVADVLARGTGALTQAGQQATGGVDTTLAAIRSATGEMIEQIRSALAPLPAATADLAHQVRADIAGTVAAEISTRITERIDAAVGSLTDATRITPDIVANVSADIAARVGTQIDAAIGTLTEAARIAPELVASVSADIAARVGGQVGTAIESLTEASRIAPNAIAAIAVDIAAQVSSQIDTAISSLTEAARITPDAVGTVSADIAARIGSQVDAAIGSLIEASRLTPDVVANVSADIAERLADRISVAVSAMTNTTQLPPDLALTLATAVAERVAPRLDVAMEVLASAETTLDAVGRRTNALCEAALQGLTAATEGLSAQPAGSTSVASVLADAELEIRMAEVLAPLTAAAQSSAEALTGAAEALTTRTAEAIAAAGDVLVARATEALAEIPAATANLTSATEAAVQAVTEAAGMLCGDSAALEATGRETVETVGRLLQDAAALREAGEAVTETDRAAIKGMIHEVDAVIGRLTMITATTDDAARELAGLKPIATTLETIATTLTERTEHLDAASQRFTTAGESVIERLADNASLGEVAVQALPVIAAEVDTVTAALRTVAETLSANAVTTPLDIERLERLNQRFEITAAGLPGSIEARVAAAIPGNLPDAAMRLEALAPKLDHLDAVGSRLESLAERLPNELAAQVRDAIPMSLSDAANRLDATAPHLEQVSVRLEAAVDGLQQTMPQTASRLEALGPKLEQLDATRDRLDALAARLPAELGEVLGQAIPAGLPEAADRLNAATPTLETLAQRLEHLADRLPGDIAGSLNMAIPVGLPEAAARLEAVADRLPRELADSVSQAIPVGLPEAAARLDAATPVLDAVTQRLEALADRLPGELAGSVSHAIPVGLPEAAARLEAATPALGTVAQRLEAVADRLPVSVSQAIPFGLPEAAARLEAATPALDTVAQRLEFLADRLPVGVSQAIPFGLPEAAARLDAATPALKAVAERLEVLVDRLPGELTSSVSQAIPSGLPEAAARLDAATPVLDTVAQRLEVLASHLPAELAGRLHDVIHRALPDTASRLEAMAPRLEHLDRLSQRLETVATQLPDSVTARIPMTLVDTADRLGAVGTRLETALSRLPDQGSEDVSAITTLVALTGDIGESVKRVEAALVEHDGALISLIGSMTRVQAATDDLQAIRPEPAPPAIGDETSLGAALRHLDGVADQSEQLLLQSEALAEAVMAGRASALSSLLADRAPTLLARVEIATRRLRSAATALAIASDGPAVGQQRLSA
ncbi:MAG TPA: hypothetical protein VFG62_01085 [Rhodopila sp.]|nr:hypothetical protein [Rhodopila sp.]